ncbi:MAG TPA: hypothetical protein VFR39_09430 [Burkholderiales bacterium]|nr:hypothetical protein [Burkholderiales bacterium]
MKRFGLLCAILLAAGCASLPQVPPAGMPAQVTAPNVREGDSWVYSLHDGYTKLPRGKLEYRVNSVQGDTVTVGLQHDGRQTTQHYTRDWNWRERPMTNLQNFRYEPAYAALPFPLEAGKSWQAYVKATDPATGKENRVRIDGKVLGWERVKVPAGEFDTILVRRLVYAGNADTTRGEENISEYDWYSPALGGIVKHASSSSYYDKTQGCDGRYCSAWVKNNWNVVELLSHPAR